MCPREAKSSIQEIRALTLMLLEWRRLTLFLLVSWRSSSSLPLQQTLHEKWDEYRSLMVQEQRLVHGGFRSRLAPFGLRGSSSSPSSNPQAS